MSKLSNVNKFIQVLDDNDDMFFSTGSLKDDYEYIKSVLSTQGYYAGARLRYFFDDDFNLIKTEYRQFGA